MATRDQLETALRRLGARRIEFFEAEYATVFIMVEGGRQQDHEDAVGNLILAGIRWEIRTWRAPWWWRAWWWFRGTFVKPQRELQQGDPYR